MSTSKKTVKQSGDEHIRSPSARKTYSESEKLLVCVLHEQMKSSDRVAELLKMSGSSVRYILKANPGLKKKANEIVTLRAEEEAKELLCEMKERAIGAVEALLEAVAGAEAIKKSNSQQLAIAMATLMDKFSLIPQSAAEEENKGVIILTARAEPEKEINNGQRK